MTQRIPMPDESQYEELVKMGVEIIVGDGSKYVEYTLPDGWKMVDDSWRQDLPNYYIIDASNMKRVSIRGSWKQTYDNDIALYIIENPTLFEPKKEATKQATETSIEGLLTKNDDPTRKLDPVPLDEPFTPNA